MRKVKLFTVPYHLGEFAVGVGAGPKVVSERLTSYHFDQVSVPEGGPVLERIARINRAQAAAVRPVIEAGDLPVVISGNCNAVLGALAAIDDPDAGVIWFDAHPDLNTPETSLTGYLDGMPLATALHLGQPGLSQQVGAPRLKSEKLLLIGARDIDSGEANAIETHAISVLEALTVHEDQSRIAASVQQLAQNSGKVYVHLDLDVFSPELVPGTPYPVAGGLTWGQIEAALDLINQHLQIDAVGITYFDPYLDSDGSTLQLVRTIIEAIIEWAT